MSSERHISLAHGNGGRYMRELIVEIFDRHLANPDLDVSLDAAPMPLPSTGRAMISTDGFIVQPLEFPGGDIGSLAVHGTVNDLAVSGATPLYLTLNAFIEEGLEIVQLDRIVASLAKAARHANVRVLAGDTKVVPRGNGGGVYFATTGVGVCPDRTGDPELAMSAIQPGDHILVSGPVGDHGICVLLAREEFEIHGDVRSDSASVLPLTKAAMECDGLRFMRDPTRGGLASVACEIAAATQHTIRLTETAIPVRDPVRMVCDMLGYDPYYLACEGRVVAFVAAGQATALLDAWKALPDGAEAAIIGRVESGMPRVVLETEIAGERILNELEEDPLPRIC
jgi:hydrogenase expression/formation protein HypE